MAETPSLGADFRSLSGRYMEREDLAEIRGSSRRLLLPPKPHSVFGASPPVPRVFSRLFLPLPVLFFLTKKGERHERDEPPESVIGEKGN